jgi:hypothetical protein
MLRTSASSKSAVSEFSNRRTSPGDGSRSSNGPGCTFGGAPLGVLKTATFPLTDSSRTSWGAIIPSLTFSLNVFPTISRRTDVSSMPKHRHTHSHVNCAMSPTVAAPATGTKTSWPWAWSIVWSMSRTASTFVMM